jgi:hypothetical protein
LPFTSIEKWKVVKQKHEKASMSDSGFYSWQLVKCGAKCVNYFTSRFDIFEYFESIDYLQGAIVFGFQWGC